MDTPNRSDVDHEADVAASGERKPALPESHSPVRALEIAVLVEIDDSWGRNVVEAVSSFAQQAEWRLLIAPRDAQRRLRVPRGWRGDGVIALIRDRYLLDHVKRLGLPTIDVANAFDKEDWFGRVCTDDTARARMALDHMQGRMMEHFACYAPDTAKTGDSRATAFQEAVAAAGGTCAVYSGQKSAKGQSAQNSWGAVADWLKSLPRPVGIFAPEAYPARQLAEIAHWCNLDIPDDIAILAGDEDELLCNTLSPRISSIELASRQIGIQACGMLDRIVRTKRVPRKPVMLEPLRVCARRSTSHLAIEDRQLAAAVKLIWEHAPDGIQVRDLARESAMSRRALEQRFQDVLGRTPAEEIRRVRLEKARQLIVTTSLSIANIAIDCGFSSGPSLTQAFKKQFNVTPSSLRENRNHV